MAELGRPKLVILPSPQALTEADWQKLLDYVARGGCLLVSGPVDRDEHWQSVDRLSPLHIVASLLPLAVRQTNLLPPAEPHVVEVTFPTEVQQAPLAVLRFTDGESVKQIVHGRGKIIWAGNPVEFAENYQPAAALYAYALTTAEVAPPFRQVHPLSPGVLAFPTVLKDAVLYCFSSETLDDSGIDIEDAITHAHLHFRLASQRGAILLLRRSDGKWLASYGVKRKQDPK